MDSLSDRFQGWALHGDEISLPEKMLGFFIYGMIPVFGWIYLGVLFSLRRKCGRRSVR